MQLYVFTIQLPFTGIQLRLPFLFLCPAGEAVSDPCLACLCEATSDCDLKFRCGEHLCGPFHITYDYWLDGGQQLGGNTKYPVRPYRYILNSCEYKKVLMHIELTAQETVDNY